jgi:hypothetical protein
MACPIATETICCYPVAQMAKKKIALDKAVERTAEILQAHFSTLSLAEANAMRKDIHALAVRASRTAKRGPSSKSLR